MLCGAFVAATAGLTYAVVPLYSWLCRTAGVGGVMQVATSLPIRQSIRMTNVRFDSKMAAEVSFARERNCPNVGLGQVVTVYRERTAGHGRSSAFALTYAVYPVCQPRSHTAPCLAAASPAAGAARRTGRPGPI
jgi:cytochrome c oxidase assembly protein Cox11